MSGKDYIPHADSDFDDWQRNFMTNVLANALKWQIPNSEVVFLKALQNEWATCFIAGGMGAKTLRNMFQTRMKTDARKLFESKLRYFVQRWITLNPLVNDPERTTMSVTVPKSKRTRIKRPETVPSISLMSVNNRVVYLRYYQFNGEDGSSKRGKPKNVHGLKVYYKVGDTPPLNLDDCNFSITITRSPYALCFTHKDTRKMLYCYCCWVNDKEEEGPLAPLASAVITM